MVIKFGIYSLGGVACVLKKIKRSNFHTSEDFERYKFFRFRYSFENHPWRDSPENEKKYDDFTTLLLQWLEIGFTKDDPNYK